jgi:hypothetical protein
MRCMNEDDLPFFLSLFFGAIAVLVIVGRGQSSNVQVANAQLFLA